MLMRSWYLPNALTRCTDAASKVSMGAVLTTPWTRADHGLGPSGTSVKGFERVALTPSESAVDMRGWSPADPVAESRCCWEVRGPGLSDEVFSRVDTALRIPMTDRVDSLNVAAAAAVPVTYWRQAAPTRTWQRCRHG